MDTPKETLERLQWLNHMLKNDTVAQKGPLTFHQMTVLIDAEEQFESLLSERDQYLRWFELHNFSISDVLADLKHEAEVDYVKDIRKDDLPIFCPHCGSASWYMEHPDIAKCAQCEKQFYFYEEE